MHFFAVCLRETIILPLVTMLHLMIRAIIVTCLFLFTVAPLWAQQTVYPLLFKSGVQYPTANFEAFLHKQVEQQEVVAGRYYRLVQFDKIPDAVTRKTLEQQGMRLLQYMPHRAYFASIDVHADKTAWQGHGITSVWPLTTTHKLSEALHQKQYPAWAMEGTRWMTLNVKYFSDVAVADVQADLQKAKATLVSHYKFSNRLRIKVPINNINDIAVLPWVRYVEPIDPPATPENLVGNTNHRSNAIATGYAMGRHYDGTGVNIAMGDDGIIGPHIDYQGRADQSNVSNNNGDHGDHVAGTIMGAGNLDPTKKGMAFGADLYVYSVWNAVDNTPTTYVNPGIRLTSTSYGNGCNAGYTDFAQSADRQIRQMPSLMHVFSAGNSGADDCGYGAGTNWGNVTGGIKIGKNVIAVANLSFIDGLASSSSRGPAHDGRIKPDISAVGTNVSSTVDEHTYEVKSGTSMSCPGVTGTLAQLYQAYKEMNGGIEPESGLIKAIALNTADDLGNVGPDFKFGWGRINALRAVQTLENNHYQIGTTDQGNTNSHTIDVPVGTQQVKVMVYWTDYEGAENATVALVNDLNITVVDPSNTTFNPWVLDPTPNPANLDAPATHGTDSLNNMEQVVIDLPMAGTHTVNVEGFQVPQGPQTYYVVYEFISDAIAVTYPIGGEAFVPGTAEVLRWDAHGVTDVFVIEYSADSGANWDTIHASVAPHLRHYTWPVPDTLTGMAMVRISRDMVSDTSDAGFSIIGVPQNLHVDWACPDSMQLSWDTVPGATAYEVSMLGNKYMDSVATTAADSVVLHNIVPNAEYWLSVKPLGPNAAVGRRAIAINKTPGTWNCPVPVDVAVNRILSPAPGTIFDCHDLTAVAVTIELQNTGLTPITNIPLYFEDDGGTVYNDTFTDTIPPDSTAVFTFSTLLNYATPNAYDLTVWNEMPGDGNWYNDSLETITGSGTSTTYTVPWFEDFESFPACSEDNDCESIFCTLYNGWTNETSGQFDDIDWRTDEDGTPTSSTGPYQDHNPGTTTGNYLYLEASGGCTERMGVAISPCIDLNNTTDPELSFWYHMLGVNMGELHVDIITNSGVYEDVITPIANNQGNPWRQGKVSLVPYIDEIINIRFRGITGDGSRSDMAIDDLAVYDLVGIDEASNNWNITAYPNPNNGLLYFTLQGIIANRADLSITDLQGRTVAKEQLILQQGSTQCDLSTLSNGIYLATILVDGKQQTIKLVLSK